MTGILTNEILKLLIFYYDAVYFAGVGGAGVEGDDVVGGKGSEIGVAADFLKAIQSAKYFRSVMQRGVRVNISEKNPIFVS